jgi:hypothetical protein
MQQLRSKSDDLEKYIYLASIQDTSERLYYAILVKHTAEVMPIVYTPTVGKACEQFSAIYRGTLRGMYLTLEDAGSIRSILVRMRFSCWFCVARSEGSKLSSSLYFEG